MKFVAIAFLGLLAIACAATFNDHQARALFEEFRHKHNKVYGSQGETEKRFQIFKESLIISEKLNARETGSATYGITKFSDMTPDEFRAQYLMPHRNMSQMPQGIEAPAPIVKGAVPTDFDWKEKGAVTPVKNQGQCGSCWAFSATETIESYYFLATKKLVTLSPQQIVDCDTADYGCNGGWPYLAYQYVIKAGGQDTAASYPYTAQNGQCAFSAHNIGASISSWAYVTQNRDENKMLDWVYNHGPLSICVDAESWQFYTSGVIQTCGTQLDHCVQLTGFSTQQGIQAWNVRNSWGTDWGVGGYLYVARGKDVCGIAKSVTAVTAKH